jgi:hypothetical protein
VVIKLGGRGFGSMGRSKARPPTTSVTLSALSLSASTISESAASGTVVGSIQNKTAGSTLSLPVDAGGRFAINGSNQLVVGLVALSSASSPYSITIRESLTGATNTPRDTTFQITVLAASADITLSPVDKASTITLSNANMTAARSGGTEVSHLVRTNNAIPSTGKLQWECSIASGTASVGFGICNTTQSLTPPDGNYPGHNANAFTYWMSGYIGVNDAATGLNLNNDTFGVGDVITFCYDADAKQIWCSKGTGLWNGSSSANPATGVGGIDTSSITGANYVFMALSNASSANFNAGASAFLRTVSGYTSLQAALSGGGGPASFPYTETFGGALLGTGYYVDAGATLHQGNSGKAISAARLVLTVTTPGVTYPSQVIPITGFTIGDTFKVSADYDANGGGSPLIRVSTNANGVGGVVHESGDLTGAGTYQSPDLTASQTTLYLALYNDRGTNSSCSFDNLSVSPASGSVIYSQNFSSGALPAGWNGTYLNKASNYALVSNDTSALSVVGGKLRITADATTITYPSTIYTLSGRAVGDVINFTFSYTVSANAKINIRITTSSNGSSSGLYDGTDIATSGTFNQSVTVPTGFSTLYLFIYNDVEAASTVDIDDVVITLVSAGTGGIAPAIKFLSSKYPVSFASRGGMRINLKTDVPSNYSIVAGGDGSEFTLTTDAGGNVWLTHPTGAAGKTCTVRATSQADSSITADQTHTLYQKAAIPTTTGMIFAPSYGTYTDNIQPNAIDYANAGLLWEMFAVYPDDTGKLLTTGLGWQTIWNGSAWVRTQNLAPYFGSSRAWITDVRNRIKAANANKVVILTVGGGGTWDWVQTALSTPELREQFKTDLLAEMDLLQLDGIDLDLEGSGFGEPHWPQVLDLAKRLREARPTMWLGFCMGGNIFKHTAPGDFHGMPNYWPALMGYLDWGLAMSYSMDQKGFGDGNAPLNTTYYSGPVRGALDAWHRMDFTTLIDWYEASGIDTKKVILGGTGMAAFDKGATGPDQFIHYGTARDGSGFWDQGVTYQNIHNYYTPGQDYYDYERKATYRVVDAVNGPGDGITYISYERGKDWIDRAAFALSRGLLGMNFWQVANDSSGTAIVAAADAFERGLGTPTSDPTYTSGTVVMNQTFPTNGAGNPSGWFGYSNVGSGWGADASALQVVNQKLVIQNRAGHVDIMAEYDLSGLTIGGFYSLIMDVTTDGASSFEVRMMDGNTRIDTEYFAKNLNQTGYLVRFWATNTDMSLLFYNHTNSFSTVTLDNIVLRGPITHVTTG